MATNGAATTTDRGRGPVAAPRVTEPVRQPPTGPWPPPAGLQRRWRRSRCGARADPARPPGVQTAARPAPNHPRVRSSTVGQRNDGGGPPSVAAATPSAAASAAPEARGRPARRRRPPPPPRGARSGGSASRRCAPPAAAARPPPRPRSPVQRTTPRTVAIGTSRSTPTSVSARAMSSGRSPLTTAKATVSRGVGRRLGDAPDRAVPGRRPGRPGANGRRRRRP